MLLNPFKPLQFEYNTKSMLQAGTVLAAGLVVGFLLRTPILLAAVLVLAGAVYLALNHPSLTVILFVILSLYARSLESVFPFLDRTVTVSSINIRFWDPIIFGMIFALVWKIPSGDRRVQTAFRKSFPFLGILFLILFLQIFRTIGNFGFNTLGEFRTYYGQLILVPYLCAFMTTPEKRLRMLKVLLWISFLMIPVSIINALFSPSAEFGTSWGIATSAMTLLQGLIVFYIFTERSIINIKLYWYIPIVILSGFIIVFTSHRSVWLAATAGLVALFFMQRINIKNLVTACLLILLLVSAAFFGFKKAGHLPQNYVSSRMMAFTNPSKDPTSNWRILLMKEAIKDIKQNPLIGVGLGRHFNLVIGPHRELVTTSPHNLYVSIPFQIGIPGLLAYLIFVGLLFFRFKTNRRLTSLVPLDRTLLTTGTVILVSMHAFYVAYFSVFECVSWAFIGLTASVLVNMDLNKEEKTA